MPRGEGVWSRPDKSSDEIYKTDSTHFDYTVKPNALVPLGMNRQIVLVLGPKTSGKTTLLSALDDRELGVMKNVHSTGLQVLNLSRYEFPV